MTKTFTEDDLIRFIYGETLEKESILIKEELVTNFRLREKYIEMISLLNDLDRLQRAPSNVVIQNIMDYARMQNPIRR
ncbi:MAG TPA: hypothetical protein ACFCUD_04615 [Cyclobacteriaceae bacterium]